MKLRISLGRKSLIRSSVQLYLKYKSKVIDLVLFGSSAKNKFNPHDIDIAVLLKNTKEAELPALMKGFSSFFDKTIHLNPLLVETLFNNPLFNTLLKEGISLLDQKPLYEKLGYESGALFSFNLTRLKKSQKVLFSYALHGKKGQEGILKKVKGRLLGRLVVFVPVNEIEEFRRFLESWQIEFYRMDILKI